MLFMEIEKILSGLKKIHKDKRPPITMKEVMQITGTVSTNTANFYLLKMQAAGLVRWEPTGEGKKGQWFING